MYEPGFHKIETAGFTGPLFAATLRKMADMAKETGADNGDLTLGYAKDAKPGDLVPEIILRVRRVPEEDEDDEDGGE